MAKGFAAAQGRGLIRSKAAVHVDRGHGAGPWGRSKDLESDRLGLNFDYAT